MGLNKAKGNMYGFIEYTLNFIKGICPHRCSYCYMKRFWSRMTDPRLDEKILKTDFGKDKYIFIGSGIDMWAESIPDAWINTVLHYCRKFDNTYFFQSKNPGRFADWIFPDKTILCTTLETNMRPCLLILGNCPEPKKRHEDFMKLPFKNKMITIEPVLNFNIDIFLNWIEAINPIQVNIGADSGGNKLPEPSPEKLLRFIQALRGRGINVHIKNNLTRLLKK